MFNNAQDQLADAALQSTSDIDAVARKAGLQVREIKDFSRTDGGGDLGKSPAVLQAAFSQDLLDGHLSSIIEIETGRGVVLRATDHALPQQKPLDAVRTDVVAAWKKQRGAELAAQAAQAAVKRLSAGESWDSVAKSLGQTRRRRSSCRETISRCRSRCAATPLTARSPPAGRSTRACRSRTATRWWWP